MTTRPSHRSASFLRKIGPALLTAALVLFAASPARGQLEVCNRVASTDSVRIAVGYHLEDEWASKGWFTARYGECVTVIQSSLSNRYYYLYARSHPLRTQWSGESYFCTSARAFMILGTHACGERSYQRTGFYQVDTGQARSYREDLLGGAEWAAAVAGVTHTERASMTISGSTVLVMRNPAEHAVSFHLVCYTRAGASTEFPIRIGARETAEIGYVQGWAGNFVPGERCEAFASETIPVWTHRF